MLDKRYVVQFNQDQFLVRTAVKLENGPCWAINSAGRGSSHNNAWLVLNSKGKEGGGARVVVKEGEHIEAHKEIFWDYGDSHELPPVPDMSKISKRPPDLIGDEVRKPCA